MNSDSTLDRVVKGEALLDGFSLAAPDEQWLLERFVDALSIPLPPSNAGGAVSPGRRPVGVSSPVRGLPDAAGAGPPESVSSFPLDLQDAAVRAAEAALSKRLKGLSKAKATGVAQRASLVGVPEAVLNESAHRDAACKEAQDLMRAVRDDPSMPALVAAMAARPPAAASTPVSAGAATAPAVGATATAAPVIGGSVTLWTGGDGGSGGAAPLPAAPAALSSSTSAASLTIAPPLKPCTLTTIPWVPLPQGFSLRSAVPSAWHEEVWFGPAVPVQEASVASVVAGPAPRRTVVASGPASPPRIASALADAAPSPLRVSSLSLVPPLSQRAELVLALRRIYEHLHSEAPRHNGGFVLVILTPFPHITQLEATSNCCRHRRHKLRSASEGLRNMFRHRCEKRSRLLAAGRMHWPSERELPVVAESRSMGQRVSKLPLLSGAVTVLPLLSGNRARM